jgi:flavodoxin I
MNVVVYATTSGATEAVGHTLAKLLGEEETLLVDLKRGPLEPAAFQGAHVFAGTPTYGKGDWHLLWERRKLEMVPLLRSARRVALFGLGDARHHRPTFAGGIGRLHGFCEAHGIVCAGSVLAGARTSPAIVQGRFPGLVVEYARDRRRLHVILAGWLLELDASGSRRSACTLVENAA